MLERVVIDPDTWERGGPDRQAEWTAIIADLVRDRDLRFRQDAPAELRVLVEPGRTRFELHPASASAEEAVARAELPAHEVLREIEAYIDVMREIEKTDQGYGSARLAALDMAKSLAHDDGAKALAPFLGDSLGADFPTLRRLFTLLVALRVDTTTAAGLRGHRRVR